MSNQQFRENAAWLRDMQTNGRQKMYTGRMLADGSLTVDGAPVNKAWVRDAPTLRGEVAVWGTALQPNVPVWVVNGPDGRYIEGVVWEEGTAKFGTALPSLVQPPPQGEITGANIAGLNFIPGRMRKSSLGFPYVHFDPLHYNNGYWRGGEIDPTLPGGIDQTADDLPITAYLPATAGHVGWLVGYLDPADGETYLQPAATQAGSISVLDEADLHDIPLPLGVYPLGAVAVSNGMTAWGSNARFVDMRNHLDSNGVSVPVNTDTFGDPLSSTEIETAFPGAISGFLGIMDDDGDHERVFGVAKVLDSWQMWAMTQALAILEFTFPASSGDYTADDTPTFTWVAT